MSHLLEKRCRFSYNSEEEESISPLNADVNQLESKHLELLAKVFEHNKDMAVKNDPTGKKQLYVADLPRQTSHWDEDMVFKLFKVRTCSFNVETILWPTNSKGDNLDDFEIKQGFSLKVQSRNSYGVFMDFVDQVLECLDIDEREWYANQQEELQKEVAKMFGGIVEAIGNVKTKMEPAFLKELERVSEKIAEWLCCLRGLLMINPDKISEAIYEDLFREFVRIAGLCCYRGDHYSKLTFQYKDKTGSVLSSVSSEPDLLLCRSTWRGARAVAVVEVKNNKPVKSKQGESSSASSDESNSGEGSSEQDLDNCALLKEDYPNGNPRLLTAAEKKNCSVFLPQLFGEVLAAVNNEDVNMQTMPLLHSPRGNLALKSVIGIGVVGFKVYVVNFLTVVRGFGRKIPDWNMHHIPLMGGLGTDILISEPLSLLKRQDRNKLFKILYTMNQLDFDSP